MLAYPYGTSACFLNKYVLEDIKEAYPDAWHQWQTKKSMSTATRKSVRFFRQCIPQWVLSIMAFNLFLKLARREISERVAIRQLQALH